MPTDNSVLSRPALLSMVLAPAVMTFLCSACGTMAYSWRCDNSLGDGRSGHVFLRGLTGEADLAELGARYVALRSEQL